MKECLYGHDRIAANLYFFLFESASKSKLAPVVFAFIFCFLKMRWIDRQLTFIAGCEVKGA